MGKEDYADVSAKKIANFTEEGLQLAMMQKGNLF
jgi:hypothetical protein